jgi:hypothetical protein
MVAAGSLVQTKGVWCSPLREIALDVADERPDRLEGPAPHGLRVNHASTRLSQEAPFGVT